MLGRMKTWAKRAIAAFRASLISISDPRLREYFGLPNTGAGVSVNEETVIGLSAVWRAINLISNTLAQLPLRTLRETAPGQIQRHTSVFDNPGGENGLTPMRWKQVVFAHLLLHGNVYLAKVFNMAGAIIALVPLHPLCVTVRLPVSTDPEVEEQPVGGKWFDVHLIDGTIETFDARGIVHIIGFTLDGIVGLSPITVARQSLGTAIAGDGAAADMFANGLTVAGLVTPSDTDDDVSWDDTDFVKSTVNNALTGPENQGRIAVLNRKLKFQQLTMSAEDAQFMESRQFSIEEVARWFGVPPFELMQTEKQTSWGTGIESQQRGLGRTVLAPWATCVEEYLSRLLPSPRFVKFDFAMLERPSPDRAQELLIEAMEGGLKTLNEARAELGLPPVEGGDVIRIHGQPIDTAPQPTPAEQAQTDPSQVPEDANA